MTTRTDLPTADQLVEIIHLALDAHDIEAVGHALTVLAVVDPHRAIAIYDAMKAALYLTDLGATIQ